MANKKTTERTPKDADVEMNKTVAALSYIWILCLIPLLGKKDSKFSQFHAKQGLILLVLSLLSWFPILGWLLWIAIVVISVIGVVKTLNGEWWEIPYISDWAKKINL